MTVRFIERDAVISWCRSYRYLLRRVWDYKRPRALIVMLNPSTADAEFDDATIRSCARLLDALGYGSFEVVNLFAFRATDPKDLEKVIAPMGADNERVIFAAMNRCDIVILAWGARIRWPNVRQHSCCPGSDRAKPAVYCFGTTKRGAPKHPLYLKTGTPLQTFFWIDHGLHKNTRHDQALAALSGAAARPQRPRLASAPPPAAPPPSPESSTMDFAEVFYKLGHWFGERGLRTDSLTVILNFTDPREAAAFDAELRRSLNGTIMGVTGAVGFDILKFNMCSVKIQTESPVHAGTPLKVSSSVSASPQSPGVLSLPVRQQRPARFEAPD